MRGLMMDMPLLISSLIEYAATYHSDTEIVSQTADQGLFRYNYGESHTRMKRLANALARHGINEGDRVATLAWNDHRHFELYFGISCMGAVCHTINPRLFADQIVYIVNHAEDRLIFTDPMFVPMLDELKDRLDPVEAYVVLCDDAAMPDNALPNAISYETLIAAESADFDWPQLDENAASALCYTSGTTGNPKGALYAHRSTVLHAFHACSTDSPIGVSSRDTVMPVVPLFHAQAWGIPYGAAMCGAKMVMPGAKLDGESVYRLMEDETVTVSAGVPTIWKGLLDYLDESKQTFHHLQHIVVGGSAPPMTMFRTFEEKHGVPLVHAWGMTEMSPIGTSGRLKAKTEALSVDERFEFKVKQGRAIYGVELKIVGDDGAALPQDGKAVGDLLVRGPWIASAYYNDAEATAAALDPDGWFRTGDVATIDPDGYMRLTDRSKDLIKSGGEWISSIDLENTATGHPDVAEAAVIGIAHEKWQERPLLIVVPREGASPAAEEILGFLDGKIAGWWMPDAVAFVDDIPHTATGKISKVQLRERFAGYTLPTDSGPRDDKDAKRPAE